MPRPPDERENISRGRLAGPYSTRLRENVTMALRLAVAVAGQDLIQPRVRPRAAHRVLRKLAPTLDPATPEAEAVQFVILRTTRALGLYAARHPELVAALIAATSTP